MPAQKSQKNFMCRLCFLFRTVPGSEWKMLQNGGHESSGAALWGELWPLGRLGFWPLLERVLLRLSKPQLHPTQKTFY